MKFAMSILCFAILTVASPDALADGDAVRPALPASIASAVQSLDSPNWEQREKAEFDLQGIDPAWADSLRAIAHNGATVESALRLKRSAEELFVTQRIGPARAFLGISHVPVDWPLDARVPPGFAAMRIGHTIRNTAAEKAQLQADDLILSVDGLTPTSMEEAAALSQVIGGHKPGEFCEFVVLRDVEGQLLHSRKVHGFDPRGLRDLRTRPVDWTSDERLPTGARGLLVTGGPRADARSGILSGDVIIGLDGRAIPADDPQRALATWCEGGDVDESESNSRPNVRTRNIPIPNVQIIRGGRRIVVRVPLGRVPLDVAERDQQRRMPIRGATPTRIRELRGEFDRWWSMSEFSETGDMARRIDPALYWQMNP